MTSHYNIIMVLDTEHSSLESHTNCYSGHAWRWEWYRQFIEVLGAQLHHNLSKHPVGFPV